MQWQTLIFQPVKSVEINGLRQHVCRWVSRPAFQRCGTVEISDHGGGLHRRGVELREKWLHLHGSVLAVRAVGKNQRSPVECNLFPNHGCALGNSGSVEGDSVSEPEWDMSQKDRLRVGRRERGDWIARARQGDAAHRRREDGLGREAKCQRRPPKAQRVLRLRPDPLVSTLHAPRVTKPKAGRTQPDRHHQPTRM